MQLLVYKKLLETAFITIKLFTNLSLKIKYLCIKYNDYLFKIVLSLAKSIVGFKLHPIPLYYNPCKGIY